jgi:histidinol-phosphate/aromatic aminotransferase/cobyric acid decarboxylase-like protein
VSGELIEDNDGAPLPAELQRDGAIWAAVNEELWALDPDAVDNVVRALAPLLWPWLPSNDHNAYTWAVARVSRRSGTPEWSKPAAVSQAAGFDMGLAYAADAIRDVTA